MLENRYKSFTQNVNFIFLEDTSSVSASVLRFDFVKMSTLSLVFLSSSVSAKWEQMYVLSHLVNY